MRDSSYFVVDSNIFKSRRTNVIVPEEDIKETKRTVHPSWYMVDNNKTNNHAKREEIKLKAIR